MLPFVSVKSRNPESIQERKRMHTYINETMLMAFNDGMGSLPLLPLAEHINFIEFAEWLMLKYKYNKLINIKREDEAKTQYVILRALSEAEEYPHKIREII